MSKPKETQENSIKPKKSLGQNFLVNQKDLNKIVNSADIKPSDTVLEIGPGTGLLTRLLIEKAKTVIAIEKDSRLANLLTHKFGSKSNLQIINTDALTWDQSIMKEPYKIVANLPYYAANPIIRKFLESNTKPTLLVITVQKEVAESIVAKKGQMRTLSLAVQLFCKPEIIGYIKPDSFRPKPKVMSAIVKMSVYDKPLLTLTELEPFFNLIKSGFTSARKQLPNSLSKTYNVSNELIKNIMTNINLDHKLRAQSLDLTDWENLYMAFRRNEVC